MLDFFAVITKGGFVLWCFQDPAQRMKQTADAVNALVKDVVLQERGGGMSVYDYNNIALKMAMNNEFELFFVVTYQKILKLSYLDKFLNDIQRKFTETFHEQLKYRKYHETLEFSEEYNATLRFAEMESRQLASMPTRPRTFQESDKSKKTINSMVERTSRFGSAMSSESADADKKGKKKKKKNKRKSAIVVEEEEEEEDENECNNNQKNSEPEISSDGGLGSSDGGQGSSDAALGSSDGIDSHESRDGSVAGSDCAKDDLANEEISADAIMRNRQLLFKGKLNKKNVPKQAKKVKKGKAATIWDLNNRDANGLDYSSKISSSSATPLARPDYLPRSEQIGSLKGDLRSMECPAPSDSGKSGFTSLFSSLVGGKTLSDADVAPVLDKLRDLLIGKNVAAEIAAKLCASVGSKLVGKHVGTFSAVSSVVRAGLTDALVQLLTPKRRLDILRDVRDSNAKGRPYTITFAGVNGVGKSTNLAKVCFWLVENGHRVLIAACDTFRAGAVEQLRTHVRHLNSLHPPGERGDMVTLYEQGYGKDAADIARVAIEHARRSNYDVVLVDTAGRMQDNEPLMRALAKLIIMNDPDLTLFVGEALVGNEAVDQLVKFNRALATHSSASAAKTNMIDGILLTKFDTIDDKVGAAISMTYITGQPIVFVGCGQTYADLRSLDAQAVVHSLMK